MRKALSKKFVRGTEVLKVCIGGFMTKTALGVLESYLAIKMLIQLNTEYNNML